MRYVVYTANACIIPKTDASINTHFQQFVLFMFVYFMNVKLQEAEMYGLLMFVKVD